MHIQPHVAVRGVDEYIVGSARQLQVAIRLKLGRLPVVDHAVRLKNVVLVVDDHIAGQRQGISGPLLVLGVPLDRSPG